MELTQLLISGANASVVVFVVRSGNPNSALGADNRTGVAAVLNAALEIRRNRLDHPPVTFTGWMTVALR